MQQTFPSTKNDFGTPCCALEPEKVWTNHE